MTSMTPGRRTLRYTSFDQIMPDVERLLAGHTTVGHWSLAQICRHLAIVLRRVVDMPASTPQDPSQWVGEEKKQEVLRSGLLPEGIPGPPLLFAPDDETLEPDVEVENLRQALAYYQNSPGPVIAHRIFGPLSKAEWDQFQLLHCSHHLSFATAQ